MKNDLNQIIRDCVRLSEDLYLGAEIEEIEKEFQKIDSIHDSIVSDNYTSDEEIKPVIALILNNFNAQFFALYSDLKFCDKTSKSLYQAGDISILDLIELPDTTKISPDMPYRVKVSFENEKAFLYYYHISAINAHFRALSTSSFSSLDSFKDSADKIRSFFLTLNNKSYDYNWFNDSISTKLENHTGDLFLFYYNFKNLYKIFSHMGIDAVEDIAEYIINRINEKYPDAFMVYQLSLEKICVFFESEVQDKRVVFEFHEIPIPYVMKKVLVKGSSKFDKLFDYISEG